MNPKISAENIEKACDKINILRQDINDLESPRLLPR